MINFVDDKWNFPDERKNLEKDENYLFFKNRQVTSGQIIDFSSTRRVFQFDPSEEVPVDRIRRIYFAKGVPDELMNEGQGERKENARFGTFRFVDLRSGQEIFYEEGWYDQEIDANAPLKQWRWTSREARCVIAKPHRDARLVIKGAGNNDIVANQKVIFKINGLTLDEFIPGKSVFEKSYNIKKEMLGDKDEFCLTIAVNPTFIPARAFPQNRDKRELGVQISFIYFR